MIANLRRPAAAISVAVALILGGCGDPDDPAAGAGGPLSTYPLPAATAVVVGTDDTVIELAPAGARLALVELDDGRRREVGSATASGPIVNVAATTDGATMLVAISVCDGDKTEDEDNIYCSDGRHIELWSGHSPELAFVADSRKRPGRPANELVASGPFDVSGAIVLGIGDLVTGATQLVAVTDGAMAPLDDSVFDPTANEQAVVCATSTDIWRATYRMDLENFKETDLALSHWVDGEWKNDPVPIPQEAFGIDLRCSRDAAYVLVMRQLGGDVFKVGTTDIQPVDVGGSGVVSFVTPLGSQGPVALSRIDAKDPTAGAQAFLVDDLTTEPIGPAAETGAFRFAVDVGSAVRLGFERNDRLEVRTHD